MLLTRSCARLSARAASRPATKTPHRRERQRRSRCVSGGVENA